MYDKRIPILSQNHTRDVFISNFLNISFNFSESIFFGSTEKAVLGKKYWDKYIGYQEGNFSELLKNRPLDIIPVQNYIKYGLKPIIVRVFEIIRYLTIQYCNSTEIEDSYKDSSKLLFKEINKFFEVHMLIKYIFREY